MHAAHRHERQQRRRRRPSVLRGGAVGLVLAGALGGCATSDPSASSQHTASATSTDEPPACTPTPGTGVTTDVARTIEVDGTVRSYLLHVPDGPGPGEPAGSIGDDDGARPLIVNLHGHDGNAADHDANTHLGEAASARGYVVVTPDALGAPSRWNIERRPDGPDDLAFLDRLVATTSSELCIDPARIFVAGSSLGAAFAGVAACAPPYRFAAVAMVIATVPLGCPDDVVPPVLTVRGTADPVVPYDTAPEVVRRIAEHHGCDAEPVTDEPWPGVDRARFGGCRDGAEVVFDTVQGGVHSWPGGERAAIVGNSSAGADYPATEQILAFFDAAV